MGYIMLFYYSLTILLSIALTSAISLSSYFVTRRKTFLYLTITFVAYFFDCSIPFQHDFLTPQVTLETPSFWDISTPYTFLTTGAIFLQAMWLAVCQYIDERRPAVRFGPIVAFIVLSVGALVLTDNIRWREFLYFNTRELLLFWMLGYLGYVYISHRNDAIHDALSRYVRAYFVALLLVVAIVVENVYIQLIFDPGDIPDTAWFFAERSIAENALMLYVASHVFRTCWKMLSLRFEQPPERSDAPMSESIDRVMPMYAKRNNLSKRETEVLALIVMGKDNQNIASEMTLSLNTVKVHVHNILKKTGQQNRQALIRDFWKN
ncbi:Response regulator protein vraR [Slackia heliotrinireducens]|uniref:Response regulator containing a CheY-like receiver domain and an HTH DNA-binding domain n=1 Tax=Slackia heliotrinireducens (strain ATCC 29202 / DSM 20476 / NCTC 11029 / RHS 1) TaxID=471855 RepID=C7N0S8_SLAHD|nr:helix-turn-helix transcriptional regulator [Slackia heliotrinireducens]ACV21156.1 response regulator containing a CheY-like receiver domain and an HTH DNA-binding domain [Slackia heliotrinireducens DSM 20476]VEH03862.1 Response regulator protein vraR [Slackia heliotrinireducens]